MAASPTVWLGFLLWISESVAQSLAVILLLGRPVAVSTADEETNQNASRCCLQGDRVRSYVE